MRLVCTVAVGHRNPTTIKTRHNYVKSTLVLCRSSAKENNYMVIHFTAQNKSGMKYKLLDNVNAIMTRFVNEGKATIQFKEPANDLFINADVIQLKSFLILFRKAVDLKLSPHELKLSASAAKPVKNFPTKKLVVRSQADLPVSSYPRTLEVLIIHDVGLKSISSGILYCAKLTIVDLSNNALESLPTGLSSLRIKQLNVSHNLLGASTISQWNWIDGPLLDSLDYLNMSYNNLKFLPNHIFKLHALKIMDLSHNKIVILPPGFGRLSNLFSLNLEFNALIYVPGSIRFLKLKSLNISGNNFDPHKGYARASSAIPKVLSLRESAARVVVENKFPYCPATIPKTLVDYLDAANFCLCGLPCFEASLYRFGSLHLSVIADAFALTVANHSFVPLEYYFCSMRCAKKKRCRC